MMHESNLVMTAGISGHRLWSRVFFVFLAAAYLASFRMSYVNDTSALISYMGLTYSEPSIGANVAIWILTLVPAGFLGLRLKQPSDFILILLYICVYVPSISVPFFIRLRSEMDVLLLDVTLFAGLMVMILMLQSKARKYRFVTRDKRTFWVVLWALYIAFAVWIIAVFGSSLRFVAPTDVYTSGVRFGSREIFAQSKVGFAVMMMFGSVNPLFISLGLQHRRKLLVLAGICGQLLCYCTGGLKSIMFSLIILFVLHTIIRRNMRRAAHALLMMSIALLLGCHMIAVGAGTKDVTTIMVDGLVSRILVIPGQLTAEYHDFFIHRPHLYLANIKPFSWVVKNPFDQDVILVVGEYYGGIAGVTSNAHLWAEDGIANFGLVGIIVVSALAGGVLRIVNRISARHDPCFATMAFSFAGFHLSNAPLSTALFSGGVMLSMLLLLLAHPQKIYVGVGEGTGRKREDQDEHEDASGGE